MNVWRILTLPCEEASELASRAMDERLSTAESFALSAHLLSCRLCRRFRRQAASLRAFARRKDEMPADARERVAAVLKSHEESP